MGGDERADDVARRPRRRGPAVGAVAVQRCLAAVAGGQKRRVGGRLAREHLAVGDAVARHWTGVAHGVGDERQEQVRVGVELVGRAADVARLAALRIAVGTRRLAAAHIGHHGHGYGLGQGLLGLPGDPTRPVGRVTEVVRAGDGGVGRVVDQGAEGLAPGRHRLQHAQLGVHGAVVVARVGVLVELAVHEGLAGRHLRLVAAREQEGGLGVVEGLFEGLHRLVVDLLQIAHGHAAPEADEVGTAVAVVAVDDDALDRHVALGGHLLANVPDAAGALLVRRERSLVLEVGEQQGLAGVVLDGHGPHVQVLGRAVVLDQGTG